MDGNALVTLRSGEKLQVLLGGAVAGTECPLTAQYVDGPDGQRSRTKTTDGITTGTTAVDLVTGINTGRGITGFSLYNADSASVTATIRFYNASTTTRIMWKGTLLTGESLYWSPAQGWYAVDVNGALKNATGTTSSATSEALSAGVSGGTRASVADSKAVSDSAVESTNLSTAGSKDVSQSTNVSTVDSGQTSKDVSQSTNVSTTDSKGVSGSVADSTSLSTLTSRVSSKGG